MKVLDLASGDSVEAEITKVSNADLKLIKRDKRFGFNWDIYSDNNLFKLSLTKTNEILGLLCLTDRPEPGFNFVEIDCIETRNDQRGRSKIYDHITGCLLAFAARMSFNKGYDGTLLLTSKTLIVGLYEDKYGFVNIGSIGTVGTRMTSDEANSRELIDTYLS